MYNLEVAQDHTFTVGAGQWVVHNCGSTGKPDPANQVPGQPNLYNGQRYDPDALRQQGYKLSPGQPPPDFQKSDQFRQFLKGLGQTDAQINQWEYVMQTWTKRGAPDVVNHYWQNIWDFAGMYFHHH